MNKVWGNGVQNCLQCIDPKEFKREIDEQFFAPVGVLKGVPKEEQGGVLEEAC